jgi:chemotaxis protein methyltransferase CheR
MTQEEFLRIYRFMKSRYGIDMERKKEIVQGRLVNYIHARGYSSFSHYILDLESDITGRLERELVNILTTNHTFFMREFEHFEYMKSVVLPQLKIKEARKKDLCIWCGASSTGQEPYTLAMLLMDFFC